MKIKVNFQILLDIYGEELPSIFVHFHQHKDNLLTTTMTSHRGYIVLPDGTEGNRQVSYEINHSLVKVIPKEQSPCEEDEQIKMHECIERYIERQSGCILPWRMANNDTPQEICRDTTPFKEMYVYLTMTARSEVYKLTGCKPSCTFTVGYSRSLPQIVKKKHQCYVLAISHISHPSHISVDYAVFTFT